jgi:hypothetical protein
LGSSWCPTAANVAKRSVAIPRQAAIRLLKVKSEVDQNPIFTLKEITQRAKRHPPQSILWWALCCLYVFLAFHLAPTQATRPERTGQPRSENEFCICRRSWLLRFRLGLIANAYRLLRVLHCKRFAPAVNHGVHAKHQHQHTAEGANDGRSGWEIPSHGKVTAER